MNIQEILQKINRPLFQDAAIPLLVILVGFGSFGLGRLSALETAQKPISITQAAAVGIPELQEGGQVVASKSGTKYHFPWCAVAAQISEQNKIYFESIEKARAAGYLPAGNCKGLD